MLTLTRKVTETIVIDGVITITVQQLRGNRVVLTFDAPIDHAIWRGEILDNFDERRKHA